MAAYVVLVSLFVNFENISYIVLFFSITDFEEVNIGCEKEIILN